MKKMKKLYIAATPRLQGAHLMLGEAEINRDVLATVEHYMVSERSSL